MWAFLNKKLSVLFYGVHKDGDTLAQILNKETFARVLVSHHAAVYQDFDQPQKCWAHLIRKAIKLTLQDPQNRDYRKLADGLLGVYRQAKRIKADKRLLDSTRCERVAELDDRLLDLCAEKKQLVPPTNWLTQRFWWRYIDGNTGVLINDATESGRTVCG